MSRHTARLEVPRFRYTYASLCVTAGIRAAGDQLIHGPRESDYGSGDLHAPVQ